MDQKNEEKGKNLKFQNKKKEILVPVKSLRRTKRKKGNHTLKEQKGECDRKLGEEKCRATMAHKEESDEEREKKSCLKELGTKTEN